MSSKTEPRPLDSQMRFRPHRLLNQNRQSLCSNLTAVVSPNSCTGNNSGVETRTVVVASNSYNSVDDLDLRHPSASSAFSFVQQGANHVVRVSSL